MTERQVRLSSPNLPAVPSPRVSDPTLQRTHDAVREVIETMRGTRGNTLDRAVFVRDLVATGILSLNSANGVISPGPSVDTGASAAADTSIPPALTNIIATAGFTHVLLTWNDPQYKALSHYEVHRLRVSDPNDSPGYTPDDARITVSETSQYNALLANPARTPVQQVLMEKLGDLLTKTSEYDYAKSYHLLYPADEALEDAYVAAGTALKAARLAVATAQANNVSGAAHVGSTPSPVYSDAVDSGATYLYWVRAISQSGIAGPFNAVGVAATTQPDVSGVIDELTSELNRGVVTDLIFNGLDSPSNGLSLLENLLDLKDTAEQAQQNASDALSAAISGIPPSIWDAINALFNRMASSVLNTVVEDYKLAVDVATLQDRIATAETTVLESQTETGSLAGRIDEYSTQFDTQFAQVNSALIALSDGDIAAATQVTALEAAIYDPVTGLQASHGRLDDILDLALTADSALLTTLTRLDAELDNTQGSIADILSLQIRPDSALAARLTELSLSVAGVAGEVQDLLSLTITPGSALAQKLTNLELEFAATNARVRDVMELNIDADSVLARSLRSLEGSVAAASGAITDLSQLVVEGDRVAALRVTKLEGEVDSAKGSVQEILDLRISGTTAFGAKLTSIEATANDASARVGEVLSLKIDPASVLAGKLTELEVQTDFASGAVSDMLSLRFTSDEIKNTAYANAMQSFRLELDNLQSSVQTYTYNVLNDFTDDYGNLTDPVARAGWGVRVEQSVSGVPYITGFGLNQDIYLNSQGVPTAFSEFVVAADRFAVVDPSNSDVTKNSPFIVGPDPDDPSGPSRVWIRDAMISRAAIQSLTAGTVVADMVRVGAYIATPLLNTPQINIGTWELVPGGDPSDARDWAYNPAAGRQGNFSVDSQGIMHATGAVLESALIKDENGTVILDAGNGVYSSALLNDSLYISVLNGQVQLNGTSNPGNSLVTIDSLGVRPLAGANVNNWDATDTAVASTLPATNVHFFHVRLDKTNLQVTTTLRSVASSGTSRVRFHLEVIGATVNSTGFVTSALEVGEVPTWSATNIDFNTAAANVIAPNGLAVVSGSGWLVGAGSSVDQMRFTLSKLDDSVELRLRVVEFTTSQPSLDRAMIVLGDSTAIAQFRNPPLEFWFSPRDGSDYDALLLKNGPADADATRGAPAGTLVNGVAAETVATAVTDFNASNNRNATAISAPTVQTNGTAVDHVLSTDGSADVSFEWAWSGTEADIDGFMVFVRQATASGAYTFGTTAADETVYQVPANKRAFILFGVPANKYYHFGVRAYRKTDSNVAGGMVQSVLVRTSATDEVNGYRPSSSVAFSGDVTGTINGTISANQVNIWTNISGSGKPADNATVGADWNTNLANVPTSSIFNSYSIVGVNLVPNSSFEVAQAPWVIGWVQNGGTDYTIARDMAGDSWRPVGGHNVGVRRFGNAMTGVVDLRLDATSMIPVIPSTRYELSGYVASHRCDAAITVWFYDSAGTYITESAVTPTRSSGGTNLGAWARPYLFVTAPSNARTALVGIRVSAVDAGQTDGYAWLTRMMFGEANTNQIAPSPWRPSSFTGINQLGYVGDLGATKNNIYRQTTAPTGGAYTTGDLWIDTDAAPTTVSQWDGAAWSVIGNYTTNTSQLADGANLGGTAAWSGVSGTGKPADNATRNVIYRQTTAPTGGTYTTGDLWYDTDATPTVLYSWTGSAWSVVANNVTNTNQVTDGANLGGTAIWSGVSGAGKPADNATVGAPAGTFVNGVAAETVATAVQNFNTANDRNAAAVLAPTLNTAGTAVDHAVNVDGSVNISLDWTWTGNEGDIDGFMVYARQALVSAAYTFGSNPGQETVYQVPANKRAFILYGTAANKFYHFAVCAYRSVDKDVAAGGVIRSSIVRTTATDEVNGYQPSSSVAFAGDVTGTVNSIPAANVNVWGSVSGAGKPADNATKNTVTRSTTAPVGPTDGDIWIDTSATPNLVKVRVSGAWQISANYLTAGSELSDYSALANANITLNSDGSLAGAGGGTAAPFEPYHAAMWDFRGTVGPWGGVNASVSSGADSLIQTGTAATNPYIRILHGGLSISGAIFNKVRVKYRRTAGTGAWEGNVYYTTAANTGFSIAYRKQIAAPETPFVNNKWYISEWDMESLTAGGFDWVNSVITGLRIDFAGGADETWEVDWIIVGRYGAGEWTLNTVNPSNPITSSNIGTYIAQLAVGTLHIGANTVTVPDSASMSTTTYLNTTTWTDLLSISFTVPSVGLSSIDTNIPIIISWSVEANIQNSGAASRQWRVVKDATAIYTSNSNLLDTEQFSSGVVRTTMDAGTVTWKLQAKGAAGVPVYQASMWVMAARR